MTDRLLSVTEELGSENSSLKYQAAKRRTVAQAVISRPEDIFNFTPVYVRFRVETAVCGQVWMRSVRCSPVSIIPALLHTHLYLRTALVTRSSSRRLGKTKRRLPVGYRSRIGNSRTFGLLCQAVVSSTGAGGRQLDCSPAVSAGHSILQCIVRKFKAGDSNAWVMIGDSLDSCLDHDHERQLKVPLKVTSASHNNNHNKMRQAAIAHYVNDLKRKQTA
jgi:hypothetical protein